MHLFVHGHKLQNFTLVLTKCQKGYRKFFDTYFNDMYKEKKVTFVSDFKT